MKKILLLLSMGIFSLGSVFAQNVGNPGFEQWNSSRPVGWTTSIAGTLNVTVPVLGNIPIPLSLNFGAQTTDAHSGNYALKLKANGIDLSSYGMPAFTLPGIAQLGTSGEFEISLSTIQQLASIDWEHFSMEDLENINWEELMSLANVLSRGEPFTQVPTAMKLWAKYLPPAGETDTMMIAVAAYSEGVLSSILSGNLPGTYGLYTSSDRMEEYTELTIPLSFDPAHVTCDSLIIVAVSSSLMHPNANTELYIDDISFEYDYSSISSLNKVNLSIYPNPTSDVVNIVPENQTDKYAVEFYDATGKCVKSQDNLSGNTQVNMKDCAKGVYFAKIRQNGLLTVKMIVME